MLAETRLLVGASEGDGGRSGESSKDPSFSSLAKPSATMPLSVVGAAQFTPEALKQLCNLPTLGNDSPELGNSADLSGTVAEKLGLG